MRHGLVTWAATLALVGMAAMAQDISGISAPQTVDGLNATWHVGLTNLWGVNKKGRGRGLDIYAVFRDGKWVNALGSARLYNTSVHLVQEADVKLDPSAGKLTGSLKVLITPDAYVPADGKPFVMLVELKGRVTREAGQYGLTGTYLPRREDGRPIASRTDRGEGSLIGGAGPTEASWDDSVWRFQMSQLGDPNGIDLDALDVALGVAGGKVQWGLIGVTAQAQWPATKRYPIDISGFGPVSGAGVAKGGFRVTGRHIHAGGDPSQAVRIDLVARRVQGMCGGEATITFEGGKEPAAAAPDPIAGGTRRAFGRGGASKGGGAECVVLAVGPAAGQAGAGAPAGSGKATTQDLTLTLGGVPVHVFTLQTGQPPKVAVDGKAVVVGAQRFTWDGKVLQPAVFRK